MGRQKRHTQIRAYLLMCWRCPKTITLKVLWRKPTYMKRMIWIWGIDDIVPDHPCMYVEQRKSPPPALWGWKDPKGSSRTMQYRTVLLLRSSMQRVSQPQPVPFFTSLALSPPAITSSILQSSSIWRHKHRNNYVNIPSAHVAPTKFHNTLFKATCAN